MTRWRMQWLLGSMGAARRRVGGSYVDGGTASSYAERHGGTDLASGQGLERQAQAMRRHPPHEDLVRAHEGAEGPQGIPEAADRLVLVESLPPAGRPSAGSEPRLEVHVADFQPPLGSVALGVDAADELAVVQDGQRVVAVHA